LRPWTPPVDYAGANIYGPECRMPALSVTLTPPIMETTRATI
jgi:hypothetical protein